MNGQDIVSRQYKDSCTIVELQPVKNATTNITKPTEVTVLSDQCCKLCFKSVHITGDGSAASVQQSVSLHIAPDIEIKAGSKITVTLQTGQSYEYSRSGLPAVYPSHQEVPLEIFRGYA